MADVGDPLWTTGGGGMLDVEMAAVAPLNLAEGGCGREGLCWET